MTIKDASLKAVDYRRIGSLPACLATKSCDIARATLETGQTVYTTWGRNLTAKQAAWYATHTDFIPVQLRDVSDLGVRRPNFELMLRDDDVAKLLPILSD